MIVANNLVVLTVEGGLLADIYTTGLPYALRYVVVDYDAMDVGGSPYETEARCLQDADEDLQTIVDEVITWRLCECGREPQDCLTADGGTIHGDRE